MKILCISANLPDEDNFLYIFFKTMFKGSIVKDITARNMHLLVRSKETSIDIKFMTTRQDSLGFSGRGYDAIFVDTDLPLEIQLQIQYACEPGKHFVANKLGWKLPPFREVSDDTNSTE